MRFLFTLILAVVTSSPAFAASTPRDVSQTQKNIQAPRVLMAQPVQFCGELSNANPSAFLGADGLELSGAFTVDHTFASGTCDALGTTSFANSDYVPTELPYVVVGLWCRITAATTTTAATTFHIATAETTYHSPSCTVAAGAHECASADGERLNLAAATPISVRPYNATDNLALSDALCYVYINF